MLANYCQVDIFLAQSWHLVVILWTYCGNRQFVDILGTICGQFVAEMLMFSENVDKMRAKCSVPQLSNSTENPSIHQKTCFSVGAGDPADIYDRGRPTQVQRLQP